jgi:DUF4097 and DUF4098 domain-containing protein YvlB
MSEERTRVLKLLEEGKITADEAARLIEALGTGGPDEKRERRPRHRTHRTFLRELDRIPDIVGDAVSSAFTGAFGRKPEGERHFPGKKALFVRSVSGDMCIRSWDEDKMVLEGSEGFVRTREQGDRLMLRSISGDLTVKVPTESRVELVSVSGDLNARGLTGEFKIKSVSGDVALEDFTGEATLGSVSGDLTLRMVSGELTVDSKSGDILLEPSADISGTVATRSGDICLLLRPGLNLTAEVECEEEGEVQLDLGFDHEVLEQSEHSVRFKIGDGSRRLVVRTHRGDIRVTKAKEE